MDNNDILRRIRYIFDFEDTEMISIFAAAELKVTRAQVSDWLKKDDVPDFQECSDPELATFLNGMINEKRGKREGQQPAPETTLNNNIVLRKLKIALDFQSEDILEVMKLANFPISKHELSSFFRKPGHRNYTVCKDQMLRRFLSGLQVKYRDNR